MADTEQTAAERRRNRAGRRRADVAKDELVQRLIQPRQNWYRDVLIMIALALMLVAVIVAVKGVGVANRADRHAAIANRHAEQALVRQQHGRVTAIAITCAVLSAVADAGRSVIAGASAKPETPFDRALEQIGYPPRHVRVQHAQLAGRLYVASISKRVDAELKARGIRVNARRLIRADGTIDCAVMSRLTDAQLPRKAAMRSRAIAR